MKCSHSRFGCPILDLGRGAHMPMAVSICAIVILMFARNASAVGTYLLNEKFNDMATNAAPIGGWASTATSGSVQVREVPFAEDKSVRIEKTANSGESSLSRVFADHSGKVAFEAKVLTRATDGFKAAPYIYDSNGQPVVTIGFQDVPNVGPRIVAYDKAMAKFVPIQDFTFSHWYMIRVVIDTATNTYDLWIDGVRKLNNADARTNASSLGQIKFYMDGINTGILYVDNVKMWELGSFIGGPPAPVFDVRNPPYNATGNGTTNDTAAIQAAINDCAGTGGSVYLGGSGTYLTGTLYLKSDMTFFIETTANLKASTNGGDFPKQSPPTTNNQLLNCRRAHLYAVGCTNLKIDGAAQSTAAAPPAKRMAPRGRRVV